MDAEPRGYLLPTVHNSGLDPNDILDPRPVPS